MQSNAEFPQSILQREGMRKLPGIYRYPVKSTVFREFKVAPRIMIYSSLTDNVIFVEGVFFNAFFGKIIKNASEVTYMKLKTKRWRILY